MKQCKLEVVEPTDDPTTFKRTGAHLVCWIDIDENLIVGSIVSLKDSDWFYVVDTIYHNVNLKKGEIKRNWHVGGL